VGSFGDISTYSFYPAHHITTGEGGAVMTNDPDLGRILESMRDWGRDCHCPPGRDDTCGRRFEMQMGDLPWGFDHKYVYSNLGYNLKMTDMQAAIGLAQMESLDQFIERRRGNFSLLCDLLSSEQDRLILPNAESGSEPSWFGFPITLKGAARGRRAGLMKELEDRKVGTRLLFGGNLTKQPYMRGLKFKCSGDLPNTNIVMSETFWMGVYPGISEEMVDYMVTALRKSLT
jgi:CDP-6-deoxy-D-xylo-4-hexulose-3-dehydrase